MSGKAARYSSPADAARTAAAATAATPLEPAFPVHLDPNKDYPPFALVVVLDNSWSMNEALGASVGKIDIAKEIASAAVDGLHEGDWLALVSFDSEYHNIIAPTKVKDLEPAKYEISRIGAFGMTNILGGLTEAARILLGIDAAYKHIVLMSDGRETEVGTDYSAAPEIAGADAGLALHHRRRQQRQRQTAQHAGLRRAKGGTTTPRR